MDVVKTERTAGGLRDTLIDEIDQLRAGKSDPQRAKQIAALAREAIKAAEIEMTFRQQMADFKERGISLEGHNEMTLRRLPAPDVESED